MKIIYKNEYDTAEFDKERYLESLKRYGTVDEEEFEKAIKEKIECYPTPHVSVLVRAGVNLIQEEEGARKYLEEHPIEGIGFERLRRIGE